MMAIPTLMFRVEDYDHEEKNVMIDKEVITKKSFRS